MIQKYVFMMKFYYQKGNFKQILEVMDGETFITDY